MLKPYINIPARIYISLLNCVEYNNGKIMSLITRNILHPEFELTGLNMDDDGNMFTIYINRDDLCKKIDLAKTYLIKEFNAKKGQRVVMSMTYWPNYPIWLFACSELGMKFIISDFPKTILAMEQMPIYYSSDIILWDMIYPVGFDQPQFDNKKINVRILDTYNPTEIISPMWCEPEDKIITTTSSGTTGTPKIIEHTHDFFFKNMNVNADLYGLKEHEKVWHDKNLQHGVILGVYFLPMVNRCKSHFHAPVGWGGGDREVAFREFVIDKIQAEKINRIAIFFNQMEWFYKALDIDKKQHDDMAIHYVGSVKEEYIERLVGEFKYKLLPQFGSQETGGPILYCEIDQSNYKDWNVRAYGVPTPFFNDVTVVEDNLLQVTDYNNNIIHTGDRFEIKDDTFIFLGRQDLLRCNGKTVYSSFLNSVIEEVTDLKRDQDFDVVFDSDYERWYIRTTQELNLDDLNKKMVPHIDPPYYSIHSQIVGPREQFTIDGWKFSPAMVRLAIAGIPKGLK